MPPRGAPEPRYLLQLVHEQFVALILAAAGLDQTGAQVLTDHLDRVKVAEDAGKQVRDVLCALRGGAQTQQLRLRVRPQHQYPEAAGPGRQAQVEVIGVGEGGPRQGLPGGQARAAGSG
jgi:hypothetical protein